MNRIKELRQARDLTQEALAKEAGINRVTIARYELGAISPNVTNAIKIANALDCTLDELMNPVEGASDDHIPHAQP